MRFAFWMLAALLAASCGPAGVAQQAATLAQARSGHTTVLLETTRSSDPIPSPPKSVLEIVHYPSPVGSLGAYLSPLPRDGAKHPAVIWISGGDCNTIDDFWTRRDPANDQTAAAFREAGIVTMYPSMRGGNDNPGFREGMYGEVNDVLAAADFLAKQPGIDPTRIYLAGHSTGGTMVLLTTEIDSRFRAAFAFGPVESPIQYGDQVFPLPVKDPTEIRLRSPTYWLDSIRSPVFVFEGEEGNAESLQAMASANRNPLAHFQLVPRATHFSILAPMTALIAQRILADAGPKTNIAFTQAELNQLIR